VLLDEQEAQGMLSDDDGRQQHVRIQENNNTFVERLFSNYL
jgi:hypothetical protein